MESIIVSHTYESLPDQGSDFLCTGRCTFLKDERPESASSGKEIAEGKSGHREAEYEGNRMWEKINQGQTSDLTNRNRIEGYMRGQGCHTSRNPISCTESHVTDAAGRRRDRKKHVVPGEVCAERAERQTRERREWTG